uniref:MARVEL domain-containing protein n=1 Tax=Compsopogon caeruleus TaxID=31354 RepID=A0A7S1TD29_9RHOD|mmetsp:Transcript_18080/g.37526  ORF Transcript_18080/g.37526 Transcript_18080/m.37526 type:complete len:168 (+) Transcript_18080:311-814(+)
MVDARDLLSGTNLKLFVAFAALVEFSTASDVCRGQCSGKYGFSVAVGVVSFCFAILQMLLLSMKPDLAEKVEIFNALFHTIWWAAGAWVNTQPEGIFSSVGNGYFATWAALILSVMWFWEALCLRGWHTIVQGKEEATLKPKSAPEPQNDKLATEEPMASSPTMEEV